mgnify:FL=1
MAKNCFICDKELGRLSIKYSAKDLLNKKVEIPEGMTEEDKICSNDFIGLTNHKSGADAKLRTRTQDYKKDWNKRGIIQFKNERIAILQRVWGSQVEFIAAYDDLTNEGYRCVAHDEGKEGGSGMGATGGVNSYFYFQKMEYVR